MDSLFLLRSGRNTGYVHHRFSTGSGHLRHHPELLRKPIPGRRTLPLLLPPVYPKASVTCRPTTVCLIHNPVVHRYSLILYTQLILQPPLPLFECVVRLIRLLCVDRERIRQYPKPRVALPSLLGATIMSWLRHDGLRHGYIYRVPAHVAHRLHVPDYSENN